MAESEKIDVSKHILVPKHEKLSEDEAQALLKKYNIIKKGLPKIQKTDAAIKHLDIGVGDIIRIHRKSETAGKAIYYRVVING